MTEVRFIGTSDAFGAAGRRQSAILVRSETGALLLDCGATTVTGLESLAPSAGEITYTRAPSGDGVRWSTCAGADS